jgi:hypothetical protein
MITFIGYYYLPDLFSTTNTGKAFTNLYYKERRQLKTFDT